MTTAAVGLTAGCLDSIRHIGQTRVPVDPEDPGDDPDATPGEFYHLLEENDIAVNELYHDTEDDDWILFYESAASDAVESDDEIALIYRVFSEGMVDRGAEVNHLYTEVEDRFDGQVEGWAVNAQWAEEHLDGEASDIELWNAIAGTKQYEDGEEPGADANESDEGGGELSEGDDEDVGDSDADEESGDGDGDGDSDGGSDGSDGDDGDDGDDGEGSEESETDEDNTEDETDESDETDDNDGSSDDSSTNETTNGTESDE
ncbi:hypothetical protein C483_12908 [Natrialba hulunbeirensis JCM 10989]|uniref:DUF8159 domain-containing protein n=1 Tax=Natrialba hulunbeirensis JCM 10989 TaxID=1227493 RepID=L9ZXT2_9EURY|nr:hypothetical protein [Natrialba hulunbeirensis]ELY90412.1 hypothetical protein C483_12908 [Natrialba hulunbeirensis JCM 10989]